MILEKEYSLILVNDDAHSLIEVVSLLIAFCGHDPLQADQCAILTHHKNQCEIKQGELLELLEVQSRLEKVGLTVKLEKNEFI